MVAKEKAKELVEKYLKKTIELAYEERRSAIVSTKTRELAKQSALICVDEVLENISEEVSTYNHFMMNTDYWQEVKQEINNI